MFQPPFRALAILFPCLALAACGGGGGGTGDPSSSLYVKPSVNFTPFIGSIQAEGLTSHLVLNTDSNGNASGGTIAPGITRQVFDITTSINPSGTTPDDAQIIKLTTASAPSASDVTGQIQSNGAQQFQGGGDGSSGSATHLATSLNSSLGTTSLSYSYLGAAKYITSPSSPETYASTFVGGQKTVASDMPTAGTANYSGAYEGVQIKATVGTPYLTASTDGAISMAADFGSAKVTGRVDNYRANSQAVNTSITFSGTITGSTFSGTAGISQPGTDTLLPGYLQTGSMQGGFFGPKGAEAAGVLTTKAVSTGGTNYFTQGGFGVKKN